MPAMIIDGNKVAETMRAEMRQQLIQLKEENGLVPGLAVVLVGDNPASQVYVRNKKKACEDIGITSLEYKYPQEFSEEQLLKLIKDLNEDPKVHGVLVQLPLPKQINETNVLYAIDPRKDVDGFHPVNVGKLMIGEPDFLPCTPWGCQQLLLRSGFDPSGKHVVVVGRSNIVGKPVALILVQKAQGANATVTICHTGTKNMAEITRQADILIAAAGKPEMITGDMVRDGVVVIDVGVNRVDDPSRKLGYKLVGDVHFDSVKEKAAAITPVPGGVGPMTITMLLANTIRSARRTLNSIKS